MEPSQVLAELKQIIRALVGSPQRTLMPNTTLADLGFNSVGARNLAAHVNTHFQTVGPSPTQKVGFDEITENMTLEELSALISKRL